MKKRLRLIENETRREAKERLPRRRKVDWDGVEPARAAAVYLRRSVGSIVYNPMH